MGHQVTVAEVAKFLKLPYIGESFYIQGVSSISKPRSFTLSMIVNKNGASVIDFGLQMLWLVPRDYKIPSGTLASFIHTDNPKLDFAETVTRFFIPKPTHYISPFAHIHPKANIGKNVTIGEYAHIGENVEIGRGTIINQHVVISANTIIGKNCYIKSGSIIGEDGFGFVKKGDMPIRIPHLGRVVIGDYVEIGAKCTIARGTIDDTIIGSYVKMNDQVHVAHNCQVGENTIIAACAVLSGSVKVGKNCWIAPNASLIQKIQVGDNTKIGIGTIVVENVSSNSVLMGLAGLTLKTLAKVHALLRKV